MTDRTQRLIASVLVMSAVAFAPPGVPAAGSPDVPAAGGGEPASVGAQPQTTGGTEDYDFYPMAGNLGTDMYVTNYVDLDASPGVRAYDCSSHTYDGHDAHDTTLRGSFVEQGVGIPVYAVLDGYVTRVRDGEPDRNTTVPNVPANFVQLYHGSGHITGYLHLKKDSVGRIVRDAWVPWRHGDFIKAGTQIGLMASSGPSSGPHLHFNSHTNSAGPPGWNGVPYEPNSGACDPGPNDWSTTQVDDRTSPFVHGFMFSKNAFSGSANPPEDQAVPTGVFASGVRTVNMRADLAGVAAGDPYAFTFIRPDNSTVGGPSGTFGFERRGGFAVFSGSVDLNQTGTWRARLVIDGTNVIEAPFTVNASGVLANRPPNGVAVEMVPREPTDDDVVFCRIASHPRLKDPDYQLVRYRWRWFRNGEVVRDVVTASRADAIPHHLVEDGDDLSCSVVPFDGVTAGPEATDGTEPSVGVHEGDADAELDVTILGRGTVVSTPGGISCPTDCYERYEPRSLSTVTLSTTTDTAETVTLTAKPASKKKWKFVRWGGACEAAGRAKTCSVSVSDSEFVTARFKRISA